MARAKPKWGFRMDHDAPLETRTEILEAIRERAEFEISDRGTKELARIVGRFNANRAHEPIRNRPRTRDVIETLNRLADAWSIGDRPAEEIDDVTRRHLIGIADLVEAAELGRPVDRSILASHARSKAAELQKVRAEGEGGREKAHDSTLRALILDLAEFYTKNAQKKATANFQREYDAPGGKITSPFVRFAYLVLITVEPKHRFKRNLGKLVREVFRSQKKFEKLLT